MLNCNKRGRSQLAIYWGLTSRAVVVIVFIHWTFVVGDRRLQMLRCAAAKPSITTEHQARGLSSLWGWLSLGNPVMFSIVQTEKNPWMICHVFCHAFRYSNI